MLIRWYSQNPMWKTFKVKGNECEIISDYAQSKTQWMWDQ
jgi:hypothetical protein